MNMVGKIKNKMKKSQISSIIIVFIILLLIISIIAGGRFWKIGNLITVLSNAAIIGVLASGMALIMIMGGLDLSIAANAAFAGMIMGYLVSNLSVPAPVAILAGLLTSALFGALNGFCIAIIGVAPMIATLAMQLVIRALCYLSNNAVGIPINNDFIKTIGTTLVFGKVPIYIFYFIAVIIIMAYLLENTRFGRKIYAIGGNEQAAYLSGINTKKVKVVAYVLVGLLGGVAGLMNTLSVSYSMPQAMNGREFDVIAAVVLGGVSLSGGRGTMIGTFLGVLVMTLIGNGLVLVGVQSYWQNFAQGIILLLAIIVDVKKNQKE